MADETVLLGHGSGGTMMKRIIDEVFFAAYAGEELLRGDDAAVLPAPVPQASVKSSTPRSNVTALTWFLPSRFRNVTFAPFGNAA